LRQPESAAATQLSAGLRILFAVPAYKPAWRFGGPAVSVPALAEALTRKGHRVTVFTTNANLDEVLDVEPNRPHDVDGVEVWYFEKQEPLQRLLPGVSYFTKSMGLLYSPKMAVALKESVPKTDVVHTHLPFIYPTVAAARAAFRHRKPLFYHQRGVFDPARLQFRALKKRVYMRMVEIPILRRATLLIALTDAETASYRRLGVRTPVRVIPNGIDPAALRCDGDTTAISELGISAEHTVVLFMSRIHPIKGADRLLEAFLQVAQTCATAVLVLAGPDEFGLEEAFRTRVAGTGLEQRVIFPGMVVGEMKKRLLTRADLFCLPSDAEGFSMAILEALAASTAVLISTGCHFDEVQRAQAGYVVDPSVENLRVALCDLLPDRARLRAMGERGAALVRTSYTWDRVAEQTLDAYLEGIALHRAASRA
jgi:glycosyltransferase involved in cell wall biosynthesis